MKGKKRTALIALTAVALAVVAIIAGKLVWDWVGPVPRITSLYYCGGHPWYGTTTWELTLENGVAYVEATYEPGSIDGEDAPVERDRRTLTQEERNTLDWVIFREVRVQNWPKHTGPDPSEITCQDFWDLMIVCEDGTSYEKEGYMEYPEGLTKISQVLHGTYTNGKEGNS